jgi:hypothetical protein
VGGERMTWVKYLLKIRMLSILYIYNNYFVLNLSKAH